MTLSKENKIIISAKIAEKIINSKVMILVQYTGVKSNDLTKLRSKARKDNVYIFVLKNTICRRLVENTNFTLLANRMIGHLMYCISEDIVIASKLIYNFSKNNDKLIMKSALYQGKIIEQNELIMFANIPNKKELLSKILFILQSLILRVINIILALIKKRENI